MDDFFKKNIHGVTQEEVNTVEKFRRACIAFAEAWRDVPLEGGGPVNYAKFRDRAADFDQQLKFIKKEYGFVPNIPSKKKRKR